MDTANSLNAEEPEKSVNIIAMDTDVVVKKLVNYEGSDSEDKTDVPINKTAEINMNKNDDNEICKEVPVSRPIEPMATDSNCGVSVILKTESCEMPSHDKADHPEMSRVSQSSQNKVDSNSEYGICIEQPTTLENVEENGVGASENEGLDCGVDAMYKDEVNNTDKRTEVKDGGINDEDQHSASGKNANKSENDPIVESDRTENNCLETVGNQSEKASVGPADAMSYREGDSDSDTSEESSSSEDEVAADKKASTSVNRDDDEDGAKDGAKTNPEGTVCVKTRGEMHPEDLPPLEDLKISVDESVEIQLVGNVKSIVGVLVVIEGNKQMAPLNEETVLFKENRESFGKVFEVFGPVVSPFYTVRFNSPEDIVEKNITVGLELYCAPRVEEYTHFVFVEQLKRIKGSDASWENNNEPPSWCMEFSDDEEEKKKKAKNRNKAPVDGSTDEQLTNKHPCNKQRKPRGETRTGPSSDNPPRGGQRGRRGRQPANQSSWPPTDSSTWPAQTNREPWSSPTNNGWLSPRQNQPSFNPSGEQCWPQLSPAVFTGGRGIRHQGGPPSQFNMFHHNPRGHPSYAGQGDWFQGQGQFNEPTNRPNPNCSEGYLKGNSFAQGPRNTVPIMDTRYIQNTDEMSNPHRMNRPPPSMFGEGPQFSSGLSSGAGFCDWPRGPGVPRAGGGPPGRF